MYKRLIPVFPYRIKPLPLQEKRDLGGRPCITNFKLSGGELILPLLEFRRDNATSDGVVEILAPLVGVAARLGVATSAHHRDAKRNQGVPQGRPLPRAQDKIDLRERHSKRADELGQVSIAS